jgi:hypothetical protein
MHMIELAGLANFGDLNDIIGLVDKDADALAVEVGGHEEAGGHNAHTHVRPVTKGVFGSPGLLRNSPLIRDLTRSGVC